MRVFFIHPRSKVRCERKYPCQRCQRLKLVCEPHVRKPTRSQFLNTPLSDPEVAPEPPRDRDADRLIQAFAVALSRGLIDINKAHPIL
jgi:hypothetical protein